MAPIGRAAPDDPMQVDVGQLRELRIARVHAAHVTAERHLPSLRVQHPGVGDPRPVARRILAAARCALPPVAGSFNGTPPTYSTLRQVALLRYVDRGPANAQHSSALRRSGATIA